MEQAMSTSLTYDPDRPLFIPPGKRFSITQARQAIEQVYESGKPVLIYIHGRANNVGEPKKSVKENIYKNLGKYDVSVIGFTWDADDGGYDETRPIASAESFDRFLNTLADFLESGLHMPNNRPSLLAHSMGNLVVSELAKDGRLEANRGKLFENIVFSSAAVKRKRHHLWLKRIGVSERNYIMINPNDKMLMFAGFGFKPDMLGRELKSPGVSADHGLYIDLEELEVNHRYFVEPGQKKQKNLITFYTQALSGHAVDLDTIAVPSSINRVPVFSIKSNNHNTLGANTK